MSGLPCSLAERNDRLRLMLIGMRKINGMIFIDSFNHFHKARFTLDEFIFRESNARLVKRGLVDDKEQLDGARVENVCRFEIALLLCLAGLVVQRARGPGNPK